MYLFTHVYPVLPPPSPYYHPCFNFRVASSYPHLMLHCPHLHSLSPYTPFTPYLPFPFNLPYLNPLALFIMSYSSYHPSLPLPAIPTYSP